MKKIGQLIIIIVLAFGAYRWYAYQKEKEALRQQAIALEHKDRIFLDQLKATGRVELATQTFLYTDTISKKSAYTVFGIRYYDATVQRVFFVPGRCGYFIDLGDESKTTIVNSPDTVWIRSSLILDHLSLDIEKMSINTLQEDWFSEMDNVEALRALSKRCKVHYAPLLGKSFLWNPVLGHLQQQVFSPLTDKVVILTLNSDFYVEDRHYSPANENLILKR